MDRRMGLSLAPGLRLLGYTLMPYGSSDPPQVTLFWQAEDALTVSFVIHLRLLNAGGEEVWHRTGRPVEGAYPITEWQPDEVVRDQHRLPPDLTAGNYRLQLAVQREGEPPPDASFLTLGTVTVR